MLVAEIHGKKRPEVQDDEDYLTSAVFGHLRYVSPNPFWARLWSRALSLPIEGRERSLDEIAREHGLDPSSYPDVAIAFWPRHSSFGIPEMAICFTGNAQQPLIVLVEVKLWSLKSGSGEFDQLKRYLQIADDPAGLDVAIPAGAMVVVVYLTPRETSAELRESLSAYGECPASTARLFQIGWRDVVEVLLVVRGDVEGREGIIVHDVRAFLVRRWLERFTGFRVVESLETECGGFYGDYGEFRGFHVNSSVETLEPVRGRWVNGN